MDYILFTFLLIIINFLFNIISELVWNSNNQSILLLITTIFLFFYIVYVKSLNLTSRSALLELDTKKISEHTFISLYISIIVFTLCFYFETFNLQNVYQHIRTWIDLYLADNLYKIRCPPSALYFKLFMCATIAFLSFLLYRSCLLFTKCFNELETNMMKRYAHYNTLDKFLFYLDFISPIFYVFTYLVGNFGLQVISILFIVSIRLVHLRPLVQCYLFAVLHHLEGLQKDKHQKVLIDCLKLIYIPVLKLLVFPVLLATFFMSSCSWPKFYDVLSCFNFWMCLFAFVFHLVGIYNFKGI